MSDSLENRVTRLEERVMVHQAELLKTHKEELEKLRTQLAGLNSRLTLLVIALAGNFGVAMFKTIPILEKLL